MISKEERAAEMCKYMHNIVQGLVDNANDVHVEYRMGEQTCVFEVAVDRKDLGKVILRNDYWCKGLSFTQPKSEAYGKFLKIKKERSKSKET